MDIQNRARPHKLSYFGRIVAEGKLTALPNLNITDAVKAFDEAACAFRDEPHGEVNLTRLHIEGWMLARCLISRKDDFGLFAKVTDPIAKDEWREFTDLVMEVLPEVVDVVRCIQEGQSGDVLKGRIDEFFSIRSGRGESCYQILRRLPDLKGFDRYRRECRWPQRLAQCA